MKKPTDAAMRAARKLRMKIHGMVPGIGVCQADNPENKKWLDRVTVEDAKTIEQETGLPELIEAVEELMETIESERLEPYFSSHMVRVEDALAKVKPKGGDSHQPEFLLRKD